MASLSFPLSVSTLSLTTPSKEVEEGSEDIFSLPTDDIVRAALRRLDECTHIIVWGSLLDQHMGLPRCQKNFTFLVPDEKLEALSAMLTQLNLPVTTFKDYLVRTEGDFLRRGRAHRVTRNIDPYGIQCIHLMPASLPGYTEDELEPIPLAGTTVTLYVPRSSAVYAGILRMMLKYRRYCSERSKLQSDLELLVNYHLLGLEKGPAEEGNYDELDIDKRMDEAVERIKAWGRAGHWREGEEWMEDALIGIVKGEKDILDLPYYGARDIQKTPRTRVPHDGSNTVVGDRYHHATHNVAY